MGAVWTGENKFRMWLDIEILACEAMHRRGMVPPADPDGVFDPQTHFKDVDRTFKAVGL
jgi:adenylosuccinate lyase